MGQLKDKSVGETGGRGRSGQSISRKYIPLRVKHGKGNCGG